MGYIYLEWESNLGTKREINMHENKSERMGQKHLW